MRYDPPAPNIDILPKPPESEPFLTQWIRKYADQYHVSESELTRTIDCESASDPEAINKGDPDGGSIGIGQFLTKTFDYYAPLSGIANPDITDTEQQIHVMAYMFSVGKQHNWTCWIKLYDPPKTNSVYCSCVKTARLLGLTDLPRIPSPDSLSPNTVPRVGVAVLLDYNEPHIAVITSLKEDGFTIKEGNFVSCMKTTRFIRFDDPHIRGFYDPDRA